MLKIGFVSHLNKAVSKRACSFSNHQIKINVTKQLSIIVGIFYKPLSILCIFLLTIIRWSLYKSLRVRKHIYKFFVLIFPFRESKKKIHAYLKTFYFLSHFFPICIMLSRLFFLKLYTHESQYKIIFHF